MYIPSDTNAKKYPISIKGILKYDNKIVLLKNERNEWELPGGKLETNENPTTCLKREIKEELNLDTEILEIIDTWIYNIQNKVEVFIVTYLCNLSENNIGKIKISNEHKELGLFYIEEINNLNLPIGYKESIFKVYNI